MPGLQHPLVKFKNLFLLLVKKVARILIGEDVFLDLSFVSSGLISATNIWYWNLFCLRLVDFNHEHLEIHFVLRSSNLIIPNSSPNGLCRTWANFLKKNGTQKGGFIHAFWTKVAFVEPSGWDSIRVPYVLRANKSSICFQLVFLICD